MVKNTKKSSVAHVSGRRVSTKRRKTLPFVSADRYDPKQVSTYLGYVLEPSRKFFLATQSRTLDEETSIFEGNSVKDYLYNFQKVIDYMEAKIEETGVNIL